MKFPRGIFLAFLLFFLFQNCNVSKIAGSKEGRAIWTSEKANDWYKKQGWLVGVNFMASTAINQLEMWQGETFDTVTINRELGWAQSLGMNTARVFLHNLFYEQDSIGFFKRVDIFLSIAKRHNLKPKFVFFDSCWDPLLNLGLQRAPKPL